MSSLLYKCLFGFFGSVGFGLVFRLKREELPFAAIGGFFSTYCYLLLLEGLEGNIFASAFIASLVIAIYSDILAKLLKVPAIGITVTAIIPIVPGRDLYYTMEYAVGKAFELSKAAALDTIFCTLGLAFGISAIYVLLEMGRNIRKVYSR